MSQTRAHTHTQQHTDCLVAAPACSEGLHHDVLEPASSSAHPNPDQTLDHCLYLLFWQRFSQIFSDRLRHPRDLSLLSTSKMNVFKIFVAGSYSTFARDRQEHQSTCPLLLLSYSRSTILFPVSSNRSPSPIAS